ncbi:hypothetical protein IU449_17455 [Nocardia higoensis]|uniref:Uncharacterized protein n=1 Tax=Nocardia higoensis TaxID=228599 RepID=A0ABS0DH88_9NOCA|nr:hypothetical protein [Nocardia higoensis]MBF6356309.1 hypothetical protein [Nocardia higoensis]
MEPIEINAGSWYLRALRADERIDDRPALAEGGITDPEYVGRRNADWETGTRYSWAVCEPTTTELVAEIVLTPGADGSAEITGWAQAGQDPALVAARAAVSRFAVGALGLRLD